MRERLAIEGARLSYRQNCESMQRIHISPAIGRRRVETVTCSDLHVYATAERGWCCYSCGRGGSIYDLAAALWGLGTRGADFKLVRQRLTDLFELDRAPTRERTLR